MAKSRPERIVYDVQIDNAPERRCASIGAAIATAAAGRHRLASTRHVVEVHQFGTTEPRAELVHRVGSVSAAGVFSWKRERRKAQ